MTTAPKGIDPSLKKVKNVVIRNLLCAPKEDEWPRLPEKETELLKSELKKNLASLKLPVNRKPWRELSAMPKDKRKMTLKEFEDNLPADVLKAKEVARQMRSWLFLGLNSLSRGIEGEAVSCCLLAEDVSPPTIVKHVVQLAKHAKVPVFLVAGFKKFCKDTMGFSCMALGIAKPCASSNEINSFSEVVRLVEKFYQDWSKIDRSPPEIKDEDNPPPIGKQHTTTQTRTVTTADAEGSCNFLSSASSFHLMRSSKYERAFTPDVGGETKKKEKAAVIPDGSPKKELPIEKGRMKYKLPTILRVRNNPFKLKRKKKKKKVV